MVHYFPPAFSNTVMRLLLFVKRWFRPPPTRCPALRVLAATVCDMEQFEAVASVIASAGGALQRLQLLITREPPDGPLARRQALLCASL